MWKALAPLVVGLTAAPSSDRARLTTASTERIRDVLIPAVLAAMIVALIFWARDIRRRIHIDRQAVAGEQVRHEGFER